MRLCSLVRVLFLSFSTLLLAQEALNNDAVVKMTKAGLGENVIVSMVQNQPGHYELTPDTLVALKGQGVSEKVLAAMAAKNAAPTGAAAAKATDAYDDMDVGVYYK